MANKLVFMSWIIAHLAARFSCGKCGVAAQSRIVHYPSITRHGDQVELAFRVRCACGQGGSLRVRLPLLLFGYILAWQAILEADQRARTSVASSQVIGHESELFPRLVSEYMQLISRLPTGASAEPSAADQVAFELNDEEWAEFLKRMGLNGNGGAPAES